MVGAIFYGDAFPSNIDLFTEVTPRATNLKDTEYSLSTVSTEMHTLSTYELERATQFSSNATENLSREDFVTTFSSSGNSFITQGR